VPRRDPRAVYLWIVPSLDRRSSWSPNRRQLLRWIAGLALALVILLVLLGRRGELSGASTRLAHLEWTWVFAAIAAETLSLATFAYLQQRVLRASGPRVRLAPLFAITLANNSIANTVPGEPAVSGAFRYRQYRRHGVSEAGSGWTITMLIVAQAIGMSLVLLLGIALALLGNASGGKAGVAVVALCIVVAAVTVLVRRDVLFRTLNAIVRMVRRVTGHPRGDLGARVEAAIENMRSIRLGAATTAWIVLLATFVWLFDCACLLCSFAAVDAQIPWHGVILAYGVAQIVAVLPLIPGGVGIVEGSLAVILVAYGALRIPALSAVLVYRIVSFWLAVLIGWFAFVGIMAIARRRRRRLDPAPGATVATRVDDSGRARSADPSGMPGHEDAGLAPAAAAQAASARTHQDSIVELRDLGP